MNHASPSVPSVLMAIRKHGHEALSPAALRVLQAIIDLRRETGLPSGIRDIADRLGYRSRTGLGVQRLLDQLIAIGAVTVGTSQKGNRLPRSVVPCVRWIPAEELR